MKTTLKIILVLVLVLVLAPRSNATPLLVAGNLVTVNNTSSNTAPFYLLNYAAGSQQVQVIHGALTATNAFYLTAQWTMDGTNYLASGLNWYPSNTNAATEYIPANYFTAPPQMRLVCTSTNSIQYSAFYGQ